MEHSIDYAKSGGDFIDKIVVSTDNADIKRAAIAAGIDVIDRPVELSTDTTPTIAVLKHVLETFEKEFDNVILLQPTNPLRPADLLKDAFDKFLAGNFDSLITVSPEIRKLGRITDDIFIPFNYAFGQRSQDLEPLYYENGLLYIIKSDLILKGHLLGERNYPYVIDHPFAKVDIDLKEDLEYAQYIHNKFSK